ncbi:winged helix-turn-helix transcriptional regulator [Micromonospora polyrhachis]|uniref:winged helix-turn-helix transcriptional regulator n=1 Tax=Micromonospora polyrhachis TaxID=1282883 RepID=UPI0028AB269B|nr:helix-turn-helix domain-containing protein [Micromonospora polyrhachis]
MVPDGRGATARPDPSCPVEVALRAVSGRWTTLLLRELMDRPLGFTDLRDRLPALSAKVLADRLRELQGQGLVVLRRHRGFPVRSEYALTEAGRALRPLLVTLYTTGDALLRIAEHNGRTLRHQ